MSLLQKISESINCSPKLRCLTTKNKYRLVEFNKYKIGSDCYKFIIIITILVTFLSSILVLFGLIYSENESILENEKTIQDLLPVLITPELVQIPFIPKYRDLLINCKQFSNRAILDLCSKFSNHAFCYVDCGLSYLNETYITRRTDLTNCYSKCFVENDLFF